MIDGTRERAEEERQANVIWLFGQMMMIPLATFVYGIEMLVKSMRQMQTVANQGMYAMAGANAYPPSTVSPGVERDLPRDPAPTSSADGAVRSSDIDHKETTFMDTDLRDDMLKLVRYKVLFVKREYEHAFPEREDLVSDNMDGAAFTAWKIAEFIQDLGRGETRVPKKWLDKSYPTSDGDGALKGLPEDDKKYLRVYFEVMDRYPREKFKYEEQQIRVLEEIRDKLP